ncbi:MAG: hypothetical protein KC621_00045 [Myxococcales bacterium]|nr:hypothetical protein [Myxococcales bacterium]MCB9626743.1 hypothetical protein [Sandaracinaceae bacterium]
MPSKEPFARRVNHLKLGDQLLPSFHPTHRGWVGYDGAPFELAAGDEGGLAPRTITLTVSTRDEGATDG